MLSAVALVPSAATAQYGATADPGTVLSTSLKTLSSAPRDLNALLAAGRASLELGDLQSAAGFYGRAEEAYPNSPLPKIGMGAALAMNGDATGAMAQFQRAQALGALQSMLGVDRGLAYDLLGQQDRAQLDYKAAMGGPQADEARRRLALSLAISKDIRGAATALEPLLARRDPAAVRTNAFVLALAGDREGARRTIDAAMPGSGAGARFEPFFKMLPVLRANEKAAAVHLGEFPSDAAQRYAQAEPVPISPVLSLGNTSPGRIDPPRKGAQVTPPPGKAKKPAKPVQVAEAPRRAERMAEQPSTTFAMMRQSMDPSRYASSRRKPTPAAPRVVSKDEPADPEPRPAFSLPSAAADDLAPLPSAPEPIVPVNAGSALNADGEPLLAANAIPPAPTPKLEIAAPPRSRPKVELAKAKPTIDAAKRTADTNAAGDKKAVADKKAREAKEAAAAKTGVAGTYWVQLAGGSNPDRMGSEYKRITAKKVALFAGKPGFVTSGKDYFRLLVGPFKTTDEAHAYVTKLDKAGIDSFMWTRNPAQIRIEKIST
jgi:Flp pilus assembly protein TadD